MSTSKPSDQAILNALKYVQHAAEQTEDAQQLLAADLAQTLSESDDVIHQYTHLLEDEPEPNFEHPKAVYREDSFETIHQKAQQSGFTSTSFADILSRQDLKEVIDSYEAFEDEWAAAQKLDKYDWMATGVISALSICLNLICVGEGTAQAGRQLVTWLGAPTGHVPDSPKVSFDYTLPRIFGASGNHRWNSLSHHVTPAGFIHAVRDVLNNTSTHVVNGEVVITDNITEGILKTWEKESFGSGTLGRLLTASVIVLKHWWSDVNTSLGLPGPLMMLAKFLEFGEIEYNGETLTIAQVAQKLFSPGRGQSGLDMRRFIGDSIIVLLCEVLTRLWFFCRALYDKKPLKDAFGMLFMHTKLRTALLTVHGSSCLINAGKVYMTQNPLLINTAQWMAFGRYFLGFMAEGIGKDAKKNKAHHERWIQKMRQHSSDLEALQAELQSFPRLQVG